MAYDPELLNQPFVDWSSVEESPEYETWTGPQRRSSFRNWAQYSLDYAQKKYDEAPEETKPAAEQSLLEQRQWVEEAAAKFEEAYSLGGRINKLGGDLDDVRQLLADPDALQQEGYGSEEVAFARKSVFEANKDLFRNALLAERAATFGPVDRAIMLTQAAATQGGSLTAGLDDASLEEAFYKAPTVGQTIRSFAARTASATASMLLRAFSGVADLTDRFQRLNESAYEGDEAWTKNTNLRDFGDWATDAAQNIDRQIPLDPRLDKDTAALLEGAAQMPAQVAPYFIPGVGLAVGTTMSVGQVYQEGLEQLTESYMYDAFQNELESGATPAGTPFEKWRQDLTDQEKDEIKGLAAGTALKTSAPNLVVDLVADRLLIGKLATPGLKVLGKQVAAARRASPTAAIAGVAAYKTGANMLAQGGAEMVQGAVLDYADATVRQDFAGGERDPSLADPEANPLSLIGKTFANARYNFLAGMGGAAAVAPVTVAQTAQEQANWEQARQFVEEKGPEYEKASRALEAFGNTVGKDSALYQRYQNNFERSKDEAHWVLNRMGDPAADKDRAGFAQARFDADQTARTAFAKWSQENGVSYERPETVDRETKNNVDRIKTTFQGLKGLFQREGWRQTEAELDQAQARAEQSAKEESDKRKAEAAKAEQKFVGTVDSPGVGRAAFARQIISREFPQFTFSPDYQSDEVVTGVLDALEQGQIERGTNLQEWLASQVEPLSSNQTDNVQDQQTQSQAAGTTAPISQTSSAGQGTGTGVPGAPVSVSGQPAPAPQEAQDVQISSPKMVGRDGQPFVMRESGFQQAYRDAIDDLADETKALTPERLQSTSEDMGLLLSFIDESPDLSDDQKLSLRKPFADLKGWADQNLAPSEPQTQGQPEVVANQQAESQAAAESVTPLQRAAEVQQPVRLGPERGVFGLTSEGRPVFKPQEGGPEIELSLLEASVDKDPAQLTPEDYGVENTPITVADQGKRFSVLPQRETPSIRPVFAPQPVDTAPIVAEVESNIEAHKRKIGINNFYSREAAVAALAKLPEGPVSRKDALAVGRSVGITNPARMLALAELKGRAGIERSILNGDLDAQLSLFDRSSQTPGQTQQQQPESQDKSPQDLWIDRALGAIETEAAKFSGAKFNKLRGQLGTEEGRSEIRNALGGMFAKSINQKLADSGVSDPVVRAEMTEKILVGADSQTEAGANTKSVLTDLLTNLNNTGNPFEVRKGVPYNAWNARGRNRVAEAIESQNRRGREAAPNLQFTDDDASGGRALGTGTSLSEDPQREATKQEYSTLRINAIQNSIAGVAQTYADELGLSFEDARLALANILTDAVPGSAKDINPVALGWQTPNTRVKQTALRAFQGREQEAVAKLTDGLRTALRETAQQARKEGLLSSEPTVLAPGGLSVVDLVERQVAFDLDLEEAAAIDLKADVSLARSSKSLGPLDPALQTIGDTPLLRNLVANAVATELNNGRPLLSSRELANLSKADLDKVANSPLLPENVRGVLQAANELSEDALSFVARTSGNEGMRRLAELYASQNAKIPGGVQVFFNAALIPSIGTAQGLWNPGETKVQVSPWLPKDVRDATVLHEGMHPVWDRKVSLFQQDASSPQLNDVERGALQELSELRDQVEAAAFERIDAAIASGASDADILRLNRDLLGGFYNDRIDLNEFLNEALNHKPFQDFLAELKDADAKNKTSFYRKILNAILRLVTGKNVSQDSILQRAFELSVEIGSGQQSPQTETQTEAFESILQKLDGADINAVESYRQARAESASAFEFVSPNDAEVDLTFEQAAAAISAPAQSELKDFGSRIHSELNLGQTSMLDALGDWADGAEPTTVTEHTDPNLSYDSLRIIAALKGAKRNQKSVIPFKVDSQGNQFLYDFVIPGVNLSEARQIVADAGIQYRTFIEQNGGIRVLIFDADGSTFDAFADLITQNNYEATFRVGRGEFLGSWDSREEGKQIYQSTIAREIERLGGTQRDGGPGGPDSIRAARLAEFAREAGLDIGPDTLTGTLDQAVRESAPSFNVRLTNGGVDPRTGGTTGIGKLRGGRSQAQNNEGAPTRGSDFPNEVRARNQGTHAAIERARRAIAQAVAGATRQDQGQYLIDLLIKDEVPEGLESAAEDIARLREEIPVVETSSLFKGLKQLDSGMSSRVFADTKAGAIYKLVEVKGGKAGGTFPKDIRIRPEDGMVLVTGARKIDVMDVFDAVIIGNKHGAPVFTEVAAITKDGDIVLKQPYIRGLKEIELFEDGSPDISQDMLSALDELGLSLLSDIGSPVALGQIGNRWAIFDDLHGANIMRGPDGRAVFLDSLATRLLSSEEVTMLLPYLKTPRESAAVAQAEGSFELRETVAFDSPFENSEEVKTHVRRNFLKAAKALSTDIVPNYGGYAAHYIVDDGRKTHVIEFNPRELVGYTPAQLDAVFREELIHAASGLVLQNKGLDWTGFYGDLGRSLGKDQRSRLKKVYTSAQDDVQLGAEYFRVGVQKLLYGTVTEAETKETGMQKIIALLKDVVRFFQGKAVKPEVRDVYNATVAMVRKADPKFAARVMPRESAAIVAADAYLDSFQRMLKAVEASEIRSFNEKSKYLTEPEKAKFRENTRRAFLEIYKSLPSEKEFAAVAIGGQAKRGWYENSTKALIQVFGADAPRFAALLAATSPQTSVENNLINALNTWKNWVSQGRPTDRGSIVRIMGESVMGNKGEDSVLDAWINNSVRALSSESPEDLTISGPKVNSFMLNLRGFVNEVTNDAWMANFALVDQAIFSGSLNVDGTDPGKRPGYLAMSARVRAAAEYLTRLTGETWTPAEVQETVWSWAKTLYELQERKGETRTALDILRDGDLTDEAIASTPDFATLLNDGDYRQILTEAGYGEALVGLAGIGSGPVRDARRGFAPEANSPAAQAIRAAQENAAKRLTRLYEARQKERASSRPRESAPVFATPPAGFTPSTFGADSRAVTQALAGLLNEPEFSALKAALEDKTYVTWTEAGTKAKALEFIDQAFGGDVDAAFANATPNSGLTAEQIVAVKGVVLQRTQKAANAARAQADAISAQLAGITDPAVRGRLFQKANGFRILADSYQSKSEDFGMLIMEEASAAGSELRAYRMLSDLMGPPSWVKVYKAAIVKLQKRKLDKNKTAQKIKSQINDARRRAANKTADRIQKALATLSTKRFMPPAATAEEVAAAEALARELANPVPVRDRVIQAASEDAVIQGVAALRRSLGLQEQQDPALLRVWEKRLRDTALQQIEGAIEERLRGGRVDAPQIELTEEEAEQQLRDLWRAVSDLPLAELVFNLAKADLSTADSPYASLLQTAQFDPAHSQMLKTAVRSTINVSEEIRKTVGQRGQTVAKLKIALGEANPTLTEDELTSLADAVEKIYNSEVYDASRAALDRIAQAAEEPEVKRVITRRTVEDMMPLVNMGAFSEEAVYNAIADKFGLPTWNPQTASAIEQEATALQELPEGSLQRLEAGQKLGLTILKANLSAAKGMQKAQLLANVATSLWTAAILSGPQTQLVNAAGSAASVFIESFMEASGYYAAARKRGVSAGAAREFYKDAMRAWLFAFGKDGSNTSLRALNEAAAALSTGQTRFKSEKMESLSPLEMFKFNPDTAVAGNAMMDAIVNKDWLKTGKEAASMVGRFGVGGLATFALGPIAIPVIAVENTVRKAMGQRRNSALENYASNMKLIGRLMLASDGMNSLVASSAKQSMMKRALLLQTPGMSEAQVEREMAEIQKGEETEIRDTAVQIAEDEAARGDFGPKGTAQHALAKARRVDQLIEQSTYGPEIMDNARDFAGLATFNGDPYGLVGAVMMTVFNGLTRVTGGVAKPLNPFPKTVSNLLNAAINYTPVGYARAAGFTTRSEDSAYYKAPPEKGSPEQYAMQARATAGSVALALLSFMLYSSWKEKREGKVPLFEVYANGPLDAAQRRQWQAAGGKPFTVKVGGAEFRYTDWPALNLVLGALGTAYDYAVFSDEEESTLDSILNVAVSVAGVTLNRNMLGGVSALFDALSTGTPAQIKQGALSKLVGGYVGGFTKPSFARYLETVLTGNYPENRTEEGFFLSLLPVAGSLRGMPSLNILGEPIEISFAEASFGRLASVKKYHPILSPLTEANLWLQPPQRYRIADRASSTGMRKMTAEEFYVYGRLYGEELRKFLTPGRVNAFIATARRNPQLAQDRLNDVATIARDRAQLRLRSEKGARKALQ